MRNLKLFLTVLVSSTLFSLSANAKTLLQNEYVVNYFDQGFSTESSLISRAVMIGQVSPIQGTITEISVTIGTRVNEGDVVMTMVALMTEIPIYALNAGTVIDICVEKGDVVEQGQMLFIIE